MQISEPTFQSGFILLPSNTVDARRSSSLESVEAIAQQRRCQVVEHETARRRGRQGIAPNLPWTPGDVIRDTEHPLSGWAPFWDGPLQSRRHGVTCRRIGPFSLTPSAAFGSTFAELPRKMGPLGSATRWSSTCVTEPYTCAILPTSSQAPDPAEGDRRVGATVGRHFALAIQLGLVGTASRPGLRWQLVFHFAQQDK